MRASQDQGMRPPGLSPPSHRRSRPRSKCSARRPWKQRPPGMRASKDQGAPPPGLSPGTHPCRCRRREQRGGRAPAAHWAPGRWCPRLRASRPPRTVAGAPSRMQAAVKDQRNRPRRSASTPAKAGPAGDRRSRPRRSVWTPAETGSAGHRVRAVPCHLRSMPGLEMRLGSRRSPGMQRSNGPPRLPRCQRCPNPRCRPGLCRQRWCRQGGSQKCCWPRGFSDGDSH
mmetsp:Transcript_60549/g.187867  ORF Transcript_60549/g.187867 Transcript_60549/m.187867 type:complete len:227 (+) Transcript_60549:1244-1924(+)